MWMVLVLVRQCCAIRAPSGVASARGRIGVPYRSSDRFVCRSSLTTAVTFAAVSRRYPRLSVSSGLLSQAVAGWAMAQLDINLSSFDVFWTNALQGFGFGLAYTPMTVLAFATLPAHQLTEGSGVFTLVRNFGSSLYISITVVLLVRSTIANYARMTEFVTPFNRTLAFPGLPGAWRDRKSV